MKISESIEEALVGFGAPGPKPLTMRTPQTLTETQASQPRSPKALSPSPDIESPSENHWACGAVMYRSRTVPRRPDNHYALLDALLICPKSF